MYLKKTLEMGLNIEGLLNQCLYRKRPCGKYPYSQQPYKNYTYLGQP